MPSWKVIALRPARTTVLAWSAAARHLRNLDTTVHIDSDAGGLRYGQVMWGTNVAGDVAGLAWDWREVQPDVVAMCDPMSVQTNLELLNRSEEPMTHDQQLLYLNRTIHSLPWRAQVCALWRVRPVLRRAA